jgi:hypothetical protein
MKPINGFPSYLVRNPYSYCFRMKVPKDLQKFVGRKELRFTLKTGFPGIAKRKAHFVAGQVQLIFTFLQKGGAVLTNLADDQIETMVQRTIKDSIDNWDNVQSLDLGLFEIITSSVDGQEDSEDFREVYEFMKASNSLRHKVKRNKGDL